jgi:hypothetical protein
MKHLAQVAVVEMALDWNRTHRPAVTEVAPVRLISEERASLSASHVSVRRRPTEPVTP